MKKILIPTDRTIYSLNLVKHALHLLQGEVCQIVLLNMLPLPDSITELLTLPREDENPNTQFAGALERFRKSHIIEIDTISVATIYCDNARTLQEFMRKNSIDLVLSTVPVGHVSAYLTRFNSLIKEAPCPVLYVPEFFAIKRFRKIAFVLDAEDETALLPDETLLQLLCRNEYHITLLLVAKPLANGTKIKRMLDCIYAAAVLKNVDYSIHLMHKADVTSGVVTYIDEFGVDLVVTCRRRSLRQYLRLDGSRRLSTKAVQSKVPCLTIE